MVSSFYEAAREEEEVKMCRDSSEASTMHAEQEENVECVLGKQKAKCNMHRRRNGYKSNNKHVIVASIIAIFIATMRADASPNKDTQPTVRINKCCEKFEIYVDSRCVIAQDINASKLKIKIWNFIFSVFFSIAAEWKPKFTGYEGKLNVRVDEYRYTIGLPDCGKMQMWGVFHDPDVSKQTNIKNFQ